jgi:hypothetical protein
MEKEDIFYTLTEESNRAIKNENIEYGFFFYLGIDFFYIEEVSQPRPPHPLDPQERICRDLFI